MRHRSLRWPTITVAGALALVVITVASAGNPGDLDPTFSGDGKQSIAMSGAYGTDTALGLALQSDGKLVLAGNADGGSAQGQGGDFGVARLHPNGSPDSSFDGDGKVITSFAAAGEADEAHAVAIQPADGKIVAAGFAKGVDFDDFAVARYNANGTPDSSFGGGDGMVTTDVGGPGDVASGVAIQSDGKIVVVGTEGMNFVVVRYDTSGIPDSSFDGDGIAKAKLCSGTFCFRDEAHAVAIQPSDGKIVVAGKADHPGEVLDDFGLARFNTNGSLDPTFDGDGMVTTPVSTSSSPDDVANAVVVLPSGKIVAAGYARVTVENFALVKYNANGSLDTSFGGGDAIVTTDLSPVHSTSVVYGLAVQTDGKLVAAGRAADYDLGYFHHDFGVARYNPNGSIDTSFGGGDGIVTTAIAADPLVDVATGVAIQPSDGKIVVGGYSDMGALDQPYADYDFSVARYAGVDTSPPNTTIDSGPRPYTNDSTPTFAFHSSETGSTFQCKVDSGLYAACSSPKTIGPLANGLHTFYVRAKDKAGNIDPTPAYRTFTVDTVPPETIIDTGPSGITNDNTPTFTFHSTEVGSTFSCKLDGGSYAGCTSPKTTGTLANGAHTFYVRAKDKAGNVDSTPASRPFTVQV